MLSAGPCTLSNLNHRLSIKIINAAKANPSRVKSSKGETFSPLKPSSQKLAIDFDPVTNIFARTAIKTPTTALSRTVMNEARPRLIIQRLHSYTRKTTLGRLSKKKLSFHSVKNLIDTPYIKTSILPLFLQVFGIILAAHLCLAKNGRENGCRLS